MHDSARVIIAALAGNLAVAVSKFVAYAFTGSSAMLTEAIHSAVDSGNQALLILGLRRSARPPDAAHPFGYGMEVYFWSFVVALLIFALGGAASIWEGLHKLRDPEPMSRPWINFLVLGLAILFEGASFAVALKSFNAQRRGVALLSAIHRSKDPNLFAVLLEDGAALIGLCIALLGVGLSVALRQPWADGAASIAIGLLLVLVAVFLANETRSLLTGEAASPRLIAEVKRQLAADGRFVAEGEVLSLHLGPDDILLAVTAQVDRRLDRRQAETALDEAAEKIRALDERIGKVLLTPPTAVSPRPSAQSAGRAARSSFPG